jgi:DDE superfamily endonuclease
MSKIFFPLKWKLAIVDEAYSLPNNIKKTARLHNILPEQIRRWKTTTTSLKNKFGDDPKSQRKLAQALTRKTSHTGRPPLDKEHMPTLKLTYQSLRNQDRPVSVMMLAVELKRISGTAESLHNLSRRVIRWLVREDIVQRRVTHVGQNTRFSAALIEEYVAFVNMELAMGMYSQGSIVNIDETNIFFDMAGNMTLADRGSRTVSMKTTGSSNRCTVLLGVSMSGDKLPPFVVFKGTRDGRIARQLQSEPAAFPNTMKYACQAKAWIDEPTFKDWIQQIWMPFCTARGNNAYLMMDEFSVHLMGSCLNEITQGGSNVNFILGGYTSKLQVMDVGVNKPFKGYIRSEYERFMLGNIQNRKVTREDVAAWIAAAWDKVTVATITNTWQSIGYQAVEA